MMKKTALFREQRHTVIEGEITKEFRVEVYRGIASLETKYRHFNRVVDIKAFGLIVEETWSYEGTVYRELKQDFGQFTARSGEVAYALAQIKQCTSIEAIEDLLEDLDVDFRVALQKDAMRELKRLIGLQKITGTPKVRRKKEYQPLPQIKLPWDVQ